MGLVSSDTLRYGEVSYKSLVRKFGRIAAATASPVILWDGGNGYNGWLPTEEDVQAVSTSIQDNPAGTGAYVLQFTGQGEDGLEKTFQMILNGTTAVKVSDTDPEVKFDVIYTAQVFSLNGLNLSPVTNVANLGTITISSVTTGRTMALIKPNLGRTQMMIWRCPKDQYAEFIKVDVYPDGLKAVKAQIFGRSNKLASWICVGQVDIEQGQVQIPHPFPDYIGPGVDICLVVVPEQADTNVSAQFWIKKKPIINYAELKAKGLVQ
jgi:hypothetical protein